MPRRPRISAGDIVYHVINRRVCRLNIFDKPSDYEAFENLLFDASKRHSMGLLGYCLMPNHWHLVLWPRRDGDLSKFMQRLTVTHTRRWHLHRQSTGEGALYQGRFKSFPIEKDEHLLTVLRYVERNPLRAQLVTRAQDWTWSSLQGRQRAPSCLMAMENWPSPAPPRWTEFVNEPQTDSEEGQLKACINRGIPFGNPR